MPIRINLLAEAWAAEDLRRRNPVKRFIIGGALLAALALVWSSSLMLEVMLAKKDLIGVQGEIQARTPEYDRVTQDMKKVTEAKRKLDALQKLSDARFLQGNLLNALQQTPVPGVQLTRLRVDQVYSQAEGTPSQTNRYGGATVGHPPTATEKVVVSLEAKDLSASPGDQVNKFKDAVAKQSYLQTMLDKTNGVRLANLSAPQTGPDGKLYVSFTLECHYPDQTR